jgi:integrase
MREQPITRHLADFLAAYIAALPPGSPWLFPSPGARSGHATDIRKAFCRAVEAAGLDPRQVVRHTYAPYRHHTFGAGGRRLADISDHKTLSMVARYSHQNGEHIEWA